MWFACSRALALVLVMSAATARAQDASPGVEGAESAYREGRFEEAREILDRIAAGDDLETLDEARQLLVLRVQVNTAMRDADAVTADLRRLAQLDPEWEPPEAIPPEVREELRALADTVDPIRIELTHEEVFGGVVVRAETSGTRTDLARGVRIYARAPGGEWLADDGEVLRVPTTPGGVIEYYAEVMGPGAVAVATAGSSERPLRARAAGSVAREPSAVPRVPPAPSTSSDPWPIVVGVILGVVVAAGAAVALGLYFGTQQPDTPSAAPVIRW